MLLLGLRSLHRFQPECRALTAEHCLFIDHRSERDHMGLVVSPGDRDLDLYDSDLRGVGSDVPRPAESGLWGIAPISEGFELSAQFFQFVLSEDRGQGEVCAHRARAHPRRYPARDAEGNQRKDRESNQDFNQRIPPFPRSRHVSKYTKEIEIETETQARTETETETRIETERGGAVSVSTLCLNPAASVDFARGF